MICLSGDIQFIILFMLFVLCSFPHYKPRVVNLGLPRKKHINIRRAAVKPWKKKSSTVSTKKLTVITGYHQQMLHLGLKTSFNTTIDFHRFLTSNRMWVWSHGVTHIHTLTLTTSRSYSLGVRYSMLCLSICFNEKKSIFLLLWGEKKSEDLGDTISSFSLSVLLLVYTALLISQFLIYLENFMRAYNVFWFYSYHYFLLSLFHSPWAPSSFSQLLLILLSC